MMNADSRFGRELAKFRRLEGGTFWTLLAGASLSLGMGAGFVAKAVHAETPRVAINTSLVRAALKLRLPRTPIGKVDCQRLPGLCEVVAGTTLFYVDPTARYLMIGRVYDMETRSDVTAARLLELNPDLIAAGAAGRNRADADEERAPAAAKANNVDLSELPKGGAIRWGPTDGAKVVVLSDFSCGYCRKLSGELATLGLRVEERPISIFGPESRKKAEAVLCARDPAAALHAAYADQPVPAGAKCDTSGLDGNEAFAKRHGFGGTPVIIRGDGAVIEGFRAAATLKAFIAGGVA